MLEISWEKNFGSFFYFSSNRTGEKSVDRRSFSCLLSSRDETHRLELEFQLSRCHESLNDVRSRLFPSFLMLTNQILKNFNQDFLQFATQQFARRVILKTNNERSFSRVSTFSANELVESVRVFRRHRGRTSSIEKRRRYHNCRPWLGAPRSNLFHHWTRVCLSEHRTNRQFNGKCSFDQSHFAFDLFRWIGQVNGRVRIGRVHFRLRTLKSWEKCWMNQCRFRKVQSVCNISSHSEIRILKSNETLIWLSTNPDRTWSIAQGIKQGYSCFNFSPKIDGNVELTQGAAWIAGKAILPIQSVSSKPKMPEKQNWFGLFSCASNRWSTSDLVESDAFLDSTNISVEIRALSSTNTKEKFDSTHNEWPSRGKVDRSLGKKTNNVTPCNRSQRK